MLSLIKGFKTSTFVIQDSFLSVKCHCNVIQSINQSKHISIAPYVASESEAHDSVTIICISFIIINFGLNSRELCFC